MFIRVVQDRDATAAPVSPARSRRPGRCSVTDASTNSTMVPKRVTPDRTPETSIDASVNREIAATRNTTRFKKTAQGQIEVMSVAVETID